MANRKKPMKEINSPETEKVELVAPEGTAYTIEIDGKKCFLKKPSRHTYAKVIPMMTPMFGNEPNLMGAAEIILSECFIGGDQEFRTEDEYIVPASLQCLGLIEIKEATLKKN